MNEIRIDKYISGIVMDYYIYEKFGTHICTNFDNRLPLVILDYFKCKGKIWVDMSSGWGDRLFGALMYQDIYYIGVDPNINL